jgi:hypothetical protein
MLTSCFQLGDGLYLKYQHVYGNTVTSCKPVHRKMQFCGQYDFLVCYKLRMQSTDASQVSSEVKSGSFFSLAAIGALGANSAALPTIN